MALAAQHTRSLPAQTLPTSPDILTTTVGSYSPIDWLAALPSEQAVIDATSVVIGTQRLVSKDVEFKNLGLLVIDEEQRFGVSVKEKLRALRATVDTLTLTATPIPRTLQFSLMGARDLSVIRTPPPNRQPIVTEIHSFDQKLIRDAILFETSRGGQVFFIHNRVQSIQRVASELAERRGSRKKRRIGAGPVSVPSVSWAPAGSDCISGTATGPCVSPAPMTAR